MKKCVANYKLRKLLSEGRQYYIFDEKGDQSLIHANDNSFYWVKTARFK